MRSFVRILILLSIVQIYGHKLVTAQVSFGDARLINDDWSFSRGDHPQAAQPEFDDSGWRRLNLPHDWSVEGPYSPHLASCTGYLPGGVGWYRKSLEIPGEMTGERVYIYFEGIYRDGEVFINGHSLGMRPNGYISYMYDLTPYIDQGGENTIAVRVDHSQYADSRWYTGSGIYRNVYLVFAGPVHIDQWGVYYTTPEVGRESARVDVETSVINNSTSRAQVSVVQQIWERDGDLLAENSSPLGIRPGVVNSLDQSLELENPRLWSPDDPYLYKLVTLIYNDQELIDKATTPLGIRTFSFDPDQGFFLNGENMKVKGVCLHHDAGSLGAAVPREVWERRLKTLKGIGTNAIRTSHNPQAPDLYELCNELGFLVINEAFDEWEYPKKKWIEGWNVGTPGFQGHAEFFEEWAEKDLRDMILRDRNHPSVFMWSIGNEVDYPNDPYSHPVLDQEGINQHHVWGYQPDQPNAERLGDIAKRLAAVVREYDPGRPVTAGLAGPVMSNHTDYPSALDVVGYNYSEHRYQTDHEKYPDRILYGSETGRGMGPWKAVRDNDFIFGQFIWTGIDYLGESHRWPSRGFTSGLLDLSGFKKPRAYFRKALWTNEPMIYLGAYPYDPRESAPGIDAPPLWNFDNGQMVRVVSYTNCDSALLLLNGETVGEEREYCDDSGTIHWDIPFREGILEVIGYTGGVEVARDTLETSGRPCAVNASAYNSTISAERGVAQIEVNITDSEGRPVYISDNEISCTVSGPLRLLSMESGSYTYMGNYRNNTLRVKNGRLIVYLEATGEKGEAEVTLSSPWLKDAVVNIVID